MKQKQKHTKSKFLKKIHPKNYASESIFQQFSQNLYITQEHPNQNMFSNIQVKKEDLANFKILGKFKKQIFIIMHPLLNVIGFVDQHAIHQRIRYQYYLNIVKNLQKQNLQKSKKFKTKYIQKNNKKQIQILDEPILQLLHIKQIKQGIQYTNLNLWGFQFLCNKTELYLKKYRPLFGKKLQKNILKDAALQIVELYENKCQNIPKFIDHILAERACKAAIKFNDQITIQWCQQIIYNISLCDFPWNCVHGRPTIYLKKWVNNQLQGQKYSLI